MTKVTSMHDSQLKKLLIKTHSVKPGQEERAWTQLRGRLSSPGRVESTFVGWPTACAACALMAVAAFAGGLLKMPSSSTPFASVASESPGIYATAFYSHSAQAQVVWLNGLEPSSDKLTYMDPTMIVANASDTSISRLQPAVDPNGL
jgi:hypothetical protein